MGMQGPSTVLKPLLVVLVLTLFGTAMLSGHGLAAERAAPNFTLKDLKGKSVKLEDSRAQGPVVISFWATWCRPCQMELPQLEEVHQAYKTKGVTVMAISVDEARQRSQVQQIVRRLGLSMPIPLDIEGRVLQQYNPSKGVPHLVVVGTDGNIVASYDGFSPDLKEKLIKDLDGLLAPAKPPAAP